MDDFKPFKPLKPDFGIQPLGPSPLGGGDMHESFNITPEGDIHGGHTTVRIPGGQDVHLPWNPPEDPYKP